MGTVILVRHGRTAANARGVLAGRSAGVALDATGRGQAEKTAERLAVVPLVRVVSSPLERCRETSRAILARQQGPSSPSVPGLSIERGIIECDYGDWQGRPLSELAKEPLWAQVQRSPASVRKPRSCVSCSSARARSLCCT